MRGTSFDSSLILAVIKAESNFNANAISEKGAKGLMQITDKTFAYVSEKFELGYDSEDVFDTAKNIRVGVLYLDYLNKKYRDITVMLCAYNAGEGNVDDWLKDERYSHDKRALYYIPFPETEKYIRKIEFYKKVFDKL